MLTKSENRKIKREIRAYEDMSPIAEMVTVSSMIRLIDRFTEKQKGRKRVKSK